MNMVLILFAFTLGAYAQSSAQPKEELVIGRFSSKLFSSLENEQVRSVLLRTSAKQQSYHLVFQDLKDARKAGSLRGLQLKFFPRKNDRLAMEVSIVDFKTGKKVKRVIKKSFPKNELLKISEIGLEVLFNLRPARDLNPPKKPLSRKPRPRNSEKKNTENKNLINFKERIAALKGGIAQKFAAQKKKTIKEEEKNSGDDGPIKRKTKKKSSSSIGINKNAQKEGPQNTSSKKKKLKWTYDYSFLSGIESQNFDVTDKKNSVAEVNILTNMQYLALGGEIIISNEKAKTIGFYGQLKYLSPLVNDDQVEGQSALNLGAGARWSPDSTFIFKLGYLKESLMFASLPEVGGGLKLAVYQLDMVDLYSQYIFRDFLGLFFRYRVIIEASGANEYSRPEDFSFSSSEFGAKVNSNWLWTNSQLLGGLRLSQFENLSLFPTEGREFSFLFALQKSF